MPSELVTEKEIVLFPVTNPVVPVMVETVAFESLGLAITVAMVVPKGIFTVPPFVVDKSLIVNTDNPVVLLSCTVAVYCCVVVLSEPVTINDIVLSPVTNPVVPFILDTTACESLVTVTNVTDVVPYGTIIDPPFVIDVPFNVN